MKLLLYSRFICGFNLIATRPSRTFTFTEDPSDPEGLAAYIQEAASTFSCVSRMGVPFSNNYIVMSKVQWERESGVGTYTKPFSISEFFKLLALLYFEALVLHFV
jgi:hypothetical protein